MILPKKTFLGDIWPKMRFFTKGKKIKKNILFVKIFIKKSYKVDTIDIKLWFQHLNFDSIVQWRHKRRKPQNRDFSKKVTFTSEVIWRRDDVIAKTLLYQNVPR